MSRHHHESLTDFPVIISMPLLWGDEDSFGHVNNTVYLRWAETARVEYMSRIGLWQMRANGGVGPILARIACDYRRPLTYPDTVQVGARVTSIGNRSFQMDHLIVSGGHNAVAAEVASTIVVLDYTRGVTVAVPPQVRKAIEELERKEFEPSGARR